MFRIALFLGIAALAVAGCGDDSGQGAGATPSGQAGAPLAGCTGGQVPEGFDEALIVGKSVTIAETAATAADLSLRVVFIDGQPQAATQDFNPQRMNVAVEDGIVTQFCSTG